MPKNNEHKKRTFIDKFARKYYRKHAKLNTIRHEKHEATRLERRYGKSQCVQYEEQEAPRYSAMDVANFIINYCISIGKPVSNLKLQKMLYLTWVNYYNWHEQELFSDYFYAWGFGPAVPSVYWQFCSHGGLPIEWNYSGSDDKILVYDAIEIENIVRHYIDLSIKELVELSTRPCSAWDLIRRQGGSKQDIIPNIDIIVHDCKVGDVREWL